MPLTTSSPTLPYSGQAAPGAAAAALPALSGTGNALTELALQADPTNTDNVLIGNSAAQKIVLRPGDAWSIALSDPTQLYHIAASGTQKLNYLGRV